MSVVTGNTEFFKGIGQIGFEGRESDNPLAFKWYDADAIVGGKSMKEQLRFAVAYWHTFCGTGADPFGGATKAFPWLEGADADSRAKSKMDAAFEFISKLGAPYYCFHDFDLIAEGASLKESGERLDAITDYAKQKEISLSVYGIRPPKT